MGAVLGEAVEVGGEVEWIAVDSGRVVALLVGEENDDVGVVLAESHDGLRSDARMVTLWARMKNSGSKGRDGGTGGRRHGGTEARSGGRFAVEVWRDGGSEEE